MLIVANCHLGKENLHNFLFVKNLHEFPAIFVQVFLMISLQVLQHVETLFQKKKKKDLTFIQS